MSSRSVLIIESDPRSRRALRATLGSAGFDVVTVNDAADALQAAKATSPHLVVCSPELSTHPVHAAVIAELRRLSVPTITVGGALDGARRADVSRADDSQGLLAAIHRVIGEAPTPSTVPSPITMIASIGQMLAERRGMRAVDPEVIARILATRLFDVGAVTHGELGNIGTVVIGNHVPPGGAAVRELRDLLSSHAEISRALVNGTTQVVDLGVGVAADSDLRVAAVIGLVAGDERFGSLVLGGARPFTPSLTVLVRALGPLIGQALDLGASLARERSAVRHLEAFADASRDGLVVVDGLGRVESANAAAARLWREPRATLAGALFSTLLPGCEGRVGVWGGCITTDDGHSMPVQVESRRQVDADGNERTLHTIEVRPDSGVERVDARARDPLTGVYVRQRFRDALEDCLRHARDDGQEGVALTVDIDRFHFINDTLGHAAGDQVLQLVSKILQQAFPNAAAVGRLDGDQFGVLLYPASLGQALADARRVVDQLRRTPMDLKGVAIRSTCSVGVALFPAHGTRPDAVLASANIALSDCKQFGGNRATSFRPGGGESERMEASLGWEHQIVDALRTGAFRVHFQPVVDIHSGNVVFHECLVRMQGVDGQLIPPGSFVPIAERFGVIREIDRWVAQRAVETIARDNVTLSVNLSAVSFADPELLRAIGDAIDGARIPGQRLILELTETASIPEKGPAQREIARLRDRGCRFAVDDFGRGFSSLSQLKNLEIDLVKIDGTFIRDLPRNAMDRHLVAAVVKMAHALGKRTVAECVEDIETLEMLRELGVDLVQGYFLAWPGETLTSRPLAL